jgi:hypothetical protein
MNIVNLISLGGMCRKNYLIEGASGVNRGAGIQAGLILRGLWHGRVLE